MARKERKDDAIPLTSVPKTGQTLHMPSGKKKMAKEILVIGFLMAFTWFIAPALPAFVFVAGCFYMLAGGSISRFSNLENTRKDSVCSACLYALFVAALFFCFQPTIIHDAFQYYAYLTSIVIDGDLDLFNQLYLHNTYRCYNPFPWNSARYVGTAIMESPFFLIAHGLALGLRFLGLHFPTNGYGTFYQVIVSLASTGFGMCGVLACFFLTREFFSRKISLISTIVIWFCSPLFFFMFFWNGWSHPFAFFLASAFLLLWQRTRTERTFAQWIMMGLILGLAGLTQPTTVLVVIFPLTELLAKLFDSRKKWFRPYFAGLTVCAVISLLVFSPQLSLWRITSGAWLSQPYTSVGDAHHWLDPKFYGLLFDTARHGLFAWSPLLLPACVGLLFLFRRDKIVAVTALLLMALSIYIYSCWSIWWSGVGFSNRFFIHLTPIFILGLAGFIEILKRRMKLTIITAILSIFVFWNILLMADYRALLIPHGIPEPTRSLEAPLTFGKLCSVQLYNFPENLKSLLSDRWASHTFFSTRIIHALKTKQMHDLANVTGLFFSISTLMVIGFRIFWRRLDKKNIHMKPIMLLLLLGTFLFGAHGILWFVGNNMTPPERIYRLETLDQEAVAEGPPIVLATDHPLPVDYVDIVSSLTFGHGIPQGAEVAEIVLEDMYGHHHRTVMRAGIDTAEQSFRRPEHRHLLRHGMDQTNIVRHFISNAYSDSYHDLLLFHYEWKLSRPLFIKNIRIQYTYPFGRLYLADVFLRSRP
jgi:hypothetical protein